MACASVRQKSVRGWPPSSKTTDTHLPFLSLDFPQNGYLSKLGSNTFVDVSFGISTLVVVAFVYFVLLLIRLNDTIEIVDREIDVTRNAALIEKNNRGRKSTFKYREFYSRDRNLFRRLRRKIGRVERSRWKIAIAEYRAKTRKRTRMHNRVRKTRRRSHARTLVCLYV